MKIMKAIPIASSETLRHAYEKKKGIVVAIGNEGRNA